EQLSLGRRVALKVLPAQGLAHPSFPERFRREAQAASRLHYTNIVPVFGVGEADGLHYYAMQFIQGEPLDKVLRDLRRLRKKGPRSAEPVAEPSVAGSLLSGHFGEAWPEGQAGTGDEAAAAGDAAGSTSQLSGSGEAAYWRSVARVGVQTAEA